MIIPQTSCSDLNEPDLLTFNEALACIIANVKEISGHELITISQAKGRTLAQAITAPFNVPGHTNAAVDGFALNSADLPVRGSRRLNIVGQALAGASFAGHCNLGECVAIMTGAVMPEGLDTVIMQEQVITIDNSIDIDNSQHAGQNVRRAGEDLAQGECILTIGKQLTPPDIGLLASLGIGEINVKRKLRIALASTGDELLNIGTLPAIGGIYDSNRYGLLAALDRPDVEIVNLGILSDQPDALLTCFTQISPAVDLLISSGGVSVGTADYTKMALQASGQLHFWKIALKPGRPLVFGKIANTPFFGLPGNPVAVMVTFYLLVLPALEKMLSITDKPLAPTFKAKASETFHKKQGRTEIMRGILSQDGDGNWQVKSTGPQSSGILRSMSLANAFIILPHSSASVNQGDWVTVQPFSGLF
ncbi:MAG: gephyrin-like molybdotransferase Glp [Methylococcales bacterium]